MCGDVAAELSCCDLTAHLTALCMLLLLRCCPRLQQDVRALEHTWQLLSQLCRGPGTVDLPLYTCCTTASCNSVYRGKRGEGRVNADG